jgi:hypothetical protein
MTFSILHAEENPPHNGGKWGGGKELSMYDVGHDEDGQQGNQDCR